MKQDKNYISGTFNEVNNISSKWEQVEIAPETFYKDSLFDEYCKVLEKCTGIYTDLSDYKISCVRFSEPEDATMFRMRYAE